MVGHTGEDDDIEFALRIGLGLGFSELICEASMSMDTANPKRRRFVTEELGIGEQGRGGEQVDERVLYN